MVNKIQQNTKSFIWIMAGAIFVSTVLIIILWILLTATRGDIRTAMHATAVLNVIEIPRSTNTPAIPTQTPSTTTSNEIPPSPPPGNISIGNSVQITGTGGDGLRLRSTPGLQSKVLFLGYEGEVFQVIDGPQEVDGYIWWYLTAPYDEKVQGWAVSNFITILQIP